MTDTSPDRQRFHELLPFYVNGSLDDPERQWVTAYLAAHPDAVRSVEFDKRVREVVQATHSPVPEQQRMDKLMRDFHEAYPRRSFLGQLADWFGQPHRVPAPAIAFAVVVLAVQGVALLGLLPKPGEEEAYRGVTVKCEDCETIQMTFNPDAKYSDVMDLLRQAGAQLIAGPSAQREIWVKIPRGCPLEHALLLLNGSTLIEKGSLYPNTPAGKRTCTE